MIFALFHSFFQVGKYVLLEKKPDVFFCYPQTFNRLPNANNPYLTQIMSVCDNSGISYRLLELRENVPQQSNPNAIKVNSIYWLYLIILKLLPSKSLRKKEQIFSKLLDCITFHKFRVPKIITMAGLLSEILIDINKKGKVYDLQHGIIYKNHSGYFKNGEIAPVFQHPNSHILIWGNIYYDIFKQYLHDKTDQKIHIIGYPIINTHRKDDTERKKTILFSLQFTPDTSANKLNEMKSQLETTIIELKDAGYEILLKHHPRYNSVIDISDVYKKYPYVTETKESLEQLSTHTILNITYNSTTAFEFAEYSVPTFFMINNKDNKGHIFLDSFKYPLYWNLSIKQLVHRISDNKTYQSDCRIVKQWYNQAYARFDKEKIVEILSCNKNN